MSASRAAQAWRLLVDGHRVDYGGGTRRIYPSHAHVGRQIGLPTSTVTRWAGRTGVAAARAQVVAGDIVPDVATQTTEVLVAAVARATEARLDAGHALSERLLGQVVRLGEWAMGHRVLTSAMVGRVQTLLTRLLTAGQGA